MEDFIDEQSFPTLSRTIDWGIVQSRLTLDCGVREERVSNVSVIPTVGDKYVIFWTL